MGAISSRSASLPWLRTIEAALLAWLAIGPSAQAQEMVIQPRFDAAGQFHLGVAPASEGGRWGLVDKTGVWVLPPSLSQIGTGEDGLFPFQQDGKWGFLDTTGVKRVDAVLDEVRPFEHGMAAIKLNGSWGLARLNGPLVAPRFEEISGYDGENVAARDADGWALFINVGTDREYRNELRRYSTTAEGDEDSILPTRLFSISDGAVVAAYPDGERLFDIRDGYNPHSELYLSIRRRSEGFAAVSVRSGRWGFLSRSKTVVWEGRFEDASIFSGGLASVKSGGKWGYIDKSGEFVVEPQYDAAYPFREGFAVVRSGEKRGFLRNDDQRGVFVFVEPRYEDASGFSDGIAAVKVGDKWGYISSGEGLVDGEIVELKPQ